MYKVLIADDAEPIRTGLAIGVDWAHLNCEVIGCVADGQQALSIIRENTPDIVLSDISMEPMTGLELCSVMAEEYPQIKFILLTGYYNFNDAYQAIKFGVVEFLLKPTSPTQIASAIKRAITKIKEQDITNMLYSEIQQQATENLALKQSLLLQNILMGTDYGDELPQLLEDASIDLFCYYCIAIQAYRRKGEEKTPKFYTNVRSTICRYISNVFSSYQLYITDLDQTLYILFSRNDRRSTPIETVHACCQQLSSMIDMLTDFYISVGISDEHRNVQELSTAGQEAANASLFAAYSVDETIAEFSSLPAIPEAAITQIRGNLTALSDAMRNLDHAKATVLLEDIKNNCLIWKMPFGKVYNICFYIYNACLQQILNWDIADFSIDRQHSFTHRLRRCKSIKDAFALLEQDISEAFAVINYNSRNVSLIDRIQQYVQQNYASDLSLETISKLFSFSPGYLSRLFKQETGGNLSTFIQQVRIERAKELIVSTNLHTYEIAEAVGISDPIYFSKLFKKMTNCRVRDYRQAATKPPAISTHDPS